MSETHRVVQWNRQKRRYDTLLGGVVLASIAAFVGVGAIARPELTIETLLIRSLGTTAFLLLHVVLAIGPLCRLDPRFLPLLYNRRHLGVCMALLALLHGGFSLFQFHALGDLPPLVSVLVTDASPDGTLDLFPFQPFGLAALVILLVMAATSHDFWLAQLTAPVWKAIHMSVYGAYALLVAHVALGALRSETSPLLPVLLGLGMTTLASLHLAAARREAARDRTGADASEDWVFACAIAQIPEKRARIVNVAGERVAIFRHDGKLSALSNVCQHQNGPLGEGEIRNGCVVCPWHGFEYDPASGRAPAPFREAVPTFDLRLEGERVFVRNRPNPAGAYTAALVIPPELADARTSTGAIVPADASPASAFYVGWEATMARPLTRFLAPRVSALAAAAPLLLGLIAAAQHPGIPSLFEFGHTREFIGLIAERPIPALLVQRPGDVAHCGPVSALPLVAPDKHGAAPAVAGLDGRPVRLRGTLAHVDGQALIELAPESIAPIETPPDLPSHPSAARGSENALATTALGRYRLSGEIVDSKCHFGVMNPGSGRVHRACAERCISGGIPPALLVHDRAGRRGVILLVDTAGRGVGREVLAWIGRPVTVEGELRRHGDLFVLAIDPTALRSVRDERS